MLIIAKLLANYCVNQNISKVNRFHDLKYVHLEATNKYIGNIKIKTIDNYFFFGPHFEIPLGCHIV